MNNVEIMMIMRILIKKTARDMFMKMRVKILISDLLHKMAHCVKSVTQNYIKQILY